jgi:Ca2+:H+ antiporter
MQSGDDEETLSRSQQHHMSYPSTMRSRAQNEHHSIRRVSDADLVLSEDMSLKDRQQAINEVHPFGLRLWKPALYKKSRGIESITYQSVHETPVRSYGRRFFFDWHLYPANVAWTILFGWWMAIIYVLASIILLILTGIFSKIGLGYAKMILSLASYIFWPFGRYIERKKTNSNEVTDLTTSSNFETSPLLTSSRYDSDFRSFGDSQRWSFGSFVYYAVFYLILAPMHISVSAICWFFVVSIPMAKLNYVLLGHLHREPCCLRVVGPSLSSGSLFSGEILICTYKAFGLQYIKYTYDGINILFINLLPVVCFALVDGYLIGPATHHTGIGNPFFIFVLCLLSVIPLAYYIGMAVASVSSQSSFGFGAVVNASFGSIVEIILYAIAITEGKGVLVEGAIIGSFLGTLLLLPGLSMIAGGIGPWKEQRFNVKSASVSTVLLIMALIGAFTPTIFYSIYGSYELKCLSCPPVSRNASMAGLDNEQLLKCSGCTFSLPQNPGTDPVYVERIKPLMYLCACVLPSAYGM